VLTRLYDPMLSNSSFGFRPGRVRIRHWNVPSNTSPRDKCHELSRR
jgi:hypothetical protein